VQKVVNNAQLLDFCCEVLFVDLAQMLNKKIFLKMFKSMLLVTILFFEGTCSI
jgi:hypothetical protein